MKILTKAIEKAFEKQGDTSHLKADQIKVVCKLFNPCGAGTWYLYERESEDIFMAFCDLGDPQFAELGRVSLSELLSVRLPFGLTIERDLHWTPCLLSEVIDSVKKY